MLKRVLCAIFGHKKWNSMGSLGGLSISGDLVHVQQCSKCLITVYCVEPKWHFWASNDSRVYNYDIPFKNPDKHTLRSPEYKEQLGQFNKKYPIDVLAYVHQTTKKELREIGYSR